MSIQDSNMPDARPGAPLLQESDLVVRVFSRKKLGEARRRTDHPILVSAQMIHQLRNMTLKDASKELGLSATALKSVCRRVGIMAWPFKTAKDTRNVKKSRSVTAVRASAWPDDGDTTAPKTPPSAVPTPPPSPTPTSKCIESPPWCVVATPTHEIELLEMPRKPAVTTPEHCNVPPSRPAKDTSVHGARTLPRPQSFPGDVAPLRGYVGVSQAASYGAHMMDGALTARTTPAHAGGPHHPHARLGARPLPLPHFFTAAHDLSVPTPEELIGLAPSTPSAPGGIPWEGGEFIREHV
ncbi:hypothetical protein T484DRAFT_3279877 [Baffinella frigidus]|nr:hypothetical protein T484DRAFT_3279877 [Cryptophyta sp. CCMP2293]